MGEVPHDEKLRLLSGARATLFPIRWNEPFGLVMIESLACGTPVLAYPEGAAPEVIVDGETGFLVDGEAEMADAIASVGEIDRHACRAAVEGYFSVDRMVARAHRAVRRRGRGPGGPGRGSGQRQGQVDDGGSSGGDGDGGAGEPRAGGDGSRPPPDATAIPSR